MSPRKKVLTLLKSQEFPSLWKEISLLSGKELWVLFMRLLIEYFLNAGHWAGQLCIVILTYSIQWTYWNWGRNGAKLPAPLALSYPLLVVKALEVRQLSSVPFISHQLCYRCGSARQVRKTGVAWLLFRKVTAFCLNQRGWSLWPFTCMSDWWSLLMSKGQNIYPSMSWCQRFLKTFLMKGCEDRYTNEDHSPSFLWVPVFHVLYSINSSLSITPFIIATKY